MKRPSHMGDGAGGRSAGRSDIPERCSSASDSRGHSRRREKGLSSKGTHPGARFLTLQEFHVGL